MNYVLRKRDIITSSEISRSPKTLHTYGAELSTSVEYAYAVDGENNQSFWKYVIKKETHETRVVLKILEDNKFMPKGHKEVTGHLIFDMKMEFTRKKT